MDVRLRIRVRLCLGSAPNPRNSELDRPIPGLMLSFQRLDVYQRTIEFLALTLEIAGDLPRGNADLADQLRRAAQSQPLNIAEGAGRTTRADAAKHYAIARGSAMECAAVLDVMKLQGTIRPDRYDRGTTLLAAIVAMLTKML